MSQNALSSCSPINIPAEQNVGRTAKPTFPPPQPVGLSPTLARNIQTLQERRSTEEQRATLQERAAEAITRFTGSMTFVYLHVAVFGFWTPGEHRSASPAAEVG